VALPTLVKTWNYDVNKLYATTGTATTDYQQTLRGIKNSLKAFASGWTVVGSSNSVTAGLDATDRWSTNGDLVWAAAGNAHSWIVLKQTGLATNFQLCIDLNNASPSAISMVASPNAGFTGGSTTARPTATDEIAALSQDNWITSGFVTFTARVHAWQSNDGQCTRVVGHIGGVPTLFWIFDKAQAPVTGWTYAVVAGASKGADGTNGVLRYADWWSASSWLGGRTPNGTFNAYLSCEGFNGAAFGANLVIQNELDSNWPLVPMAIVSTTAGSRGRLGSVFDLWYGSTAIGEGDTYPDDATRQFVQFGHFVFPWNGSVPLMA
jgi:hypothetical protein